MPEGGIPRCPIHGVFEGPPPTDLRCPVRLRAREDAKADGWDEQSSSRRPEICGRMLELEPLPPPQPPFLTRCTRLFLFASGRVSRAVAANRAR